MSYDVDQILQQAIRALVGGEHFEAQRISRKLLFDQPNAVAFEILSTSLTNQIERRSAISLVGESSVDRFIAQHFLYLDSGHFYESYKEWRMRRMRKLLEIYGMDFEGKRILELGAGIGDIGSFFAELGAEVMGLEGRAVNCNLAKLRFRHLKNYEIRQCNLEDDLGDLGRFDLIINFGLIEVIENFEALLKTCMDLSDTMFLETMVCDSEDPHKLVYVDMPADQYNDWPLSGKSPRPSPSYIERLFSENGFRICRHFDHDLNVSPHCYNWSHKNDGSVKNEQRRFWSFVKQ
jgi:2-polyprenyl-3-methyl-5-hydroxy-6-metoxy-1,4-benzoquinol methylase